MICGDATILAYDGSLRLFEKNKIYEQDELSAKNRNSNNSFEKKILDTIEKSKSELGGITDIQAQKLAKNINSIFKTEEDVKKEAKNTYGSDNDESKNKIYALMAKVFVESTGVTSIEGKNVDADYAKRNFVAKSNTSNNKYYIYACQCYEYMQFKRSIFKSESSQIEYNGEKGKITKMVFTFTEVVR